MSDSVFLDRKVRYRMSPKTGLAFKLLRNQVGSLLAARLRNDSSENVGSLWEQLIMKILGHIKVEDIEKKPETVTLVVNNKIEAVRPSRM